MTFFYIFLGIALVLAIGFAAVFISLIRGFNNSKKSH